MIILNWQNFLSWFVVYLPGLAVSVACHAQAAVSVSGNFAGFICVEGALHHPQAEILSCLFFGFFHNTRLFFLPVTHRVHSEWVRYDGQSSQFGHFQTEKHSFVIHCFFKKKIVSQPKVGQNHNQSLISTEVCKVL